jgi:hypothetical protein
MNNDEPGNNQHGPADDDTQPIPAYGPLPTNEWPTPPPVVARQSRGWRSWPRAALVAIVVTGLLAIGGTAFGITSMASDHSSTKTVAYPSSSTATQDTTAGTTDGRPWGRCMRAGRWLRHHAIRGELTNVSGDHWTVKTKKRGTFNVTITDDTKFGTRRRTAKRDDFKIGTQVGVIGKIDGQTITARRVVALPRR